MSTTTARPGADTPELGQAPIPVSTAPLRSIRPSPENDELYRAIDPGDPEIAALADSIREHGLLEPLVITQDGYILSGHRRHTAAQLAGLDHVPVRVEPFERLDDMDGFVVRLREHNRQREKSFDEKLREELITADPEDAYVALIAYREQRSRIEAETIAIRGPRRRAEISRAKEEFVAAIERVILQDRRQFWPLSDRSIHYALLNDPPLKHASKPDSRYENHPSSYKSLTELLTRLRLEGIVPMNAIDDLTRPITIWDVHPEPRSFIRSSFDDFLKGYGRDLMRSQPNHLEIVVEKNTIIPVVKPVAMEYRIPMTSGRGYSSLPPRHKMAQRYLKSGKDRLVLLIASDFDPDGEEIAHSFARSMRDDFGIQQIDAIKVAIIADHVREFNLPPMMKAKQGASGRKRFVEAHGENVWELEAIPPAELQRIFREKIDSVIDVDAFNAELDAEKADAAYLETVRGTVHRMLRTLNLGESGARGEQ